MNTKLRGIIPPLVTPLLDNNTLDVEGLERLIEHVITGGVHGIFILGTTGEAQCLSYSLKIEMIKQSSRILNKRIPLLVGISDTSVVESVRLSQEASRFGADAVVSAPPYYYAPAQPELIDFYQDLIPDLELPLFLYNMPGMTKVSFAPLTVRKIAENEKVIGFKDSSGNGTYLQSLMYEMRDHTYFSFFVGPEEMMAEMVLMGADGGVNGGANLFPQLYVGLYQAAKAGNLSEVHRLQEKVMQISSTIYQVGQYGSSLIKGIKCSLSVLGICNDFLAEPFKSFDTEQRRIIAEALGKVQANGTL